MINQENLFILKEDGIFVIGSHSVSINEKIREDELFEYEIRDREDFIDNLIMWISEATTDKAIMKQDLKLLMNLEDDYIFSSISTNNYIHSGSSEFNSTCLELIKLNKEI